MATKPKITALHLSKTTAPLAQRAVVFLVIFVTFSGILGPRIISHGLVHKDGFEIYGGAGKSLLFGVMALLLLIYKSSKKIKFNDYSYLELIWLTLSVFSLIAAWLGVGKLIDGAHGLGWPIVINLSIILSVMLATFAAFGLGNLKRLVKTYKNELVICIGLAVLFYALLLIAYSLWKVLAVIVLHSVNWLLNLVGVKTSVVPGYTLVLSKFSVTIAEYCSGIESIALFTGLYGLIGILDWERFNHKKLLVVFPIALLVLFLFNILRVFVLILGGYYINPQIAFSLFHTYAGMLFFIIYAILFWLISYKWMLKD